MAPVNAFTQEPPGGPRPFVFLDGVKGHPASTYALKHSLVADSGSSS